jgi:hypothetical protein
MKSNGVPRCQYNGCARQAKVNVLITFRDRRRDAIVRDLCKMHGTNRELNTIKGWKAMSKAWLTA